MLDTKPSTNSPDGVPDAWLTANNLATSVTASTDSDGDGQTNLQEFLNDTNPRDSNSKVRVTSLTPTSLKWLGASFRAYRIERTTNLPGAVWTPVGHVVPILPAEAVYDFPAPLGPNEFYRVISLP